MSRINFVFDRAKNLKPFTSTLWDASSKKIEGENYPEIPLVELKCYFKLLPEEIQEEAVEYGLNDSLFRDNVYFFFKSKPHLLKI
jgi:hypothetical protein